MSFLQKVIDIRSSSDPLNAIERISEGVSIRGYNMWLLFCSAVLASIGLDTSSSAVVIGAMLISPLMSPILGLGLSLGIHDKLLFVRSLKNLSAAVFLSLLASILYFLVSPFGYPTSEIEARTYPTLLDVLIALFGGIAGIVSASRSGITIAIPGVAIATALMPPLCTAGYGIATGNWMFFGGAFYLFFINAICISLATYVMVKYLRFPLREFASLKQRRNYTMVFIFLVILITAPSVYFLYSVYQKETTKQKLNNLVINPIKASGNEILKWEVVDADSVMLIKVYHSGNILSDSFKLAINNNLVANDMPTYVLRSFRVNMTKEEVNAMSEAVSREMVAQLQLQMEVLAKHDDQINEDSLRFGYINSETKIAFPFLDTLFYGWAVMPRQTSQVDTLPLVFISQNRLVDVAERDQLYAYLKARFRKDTIILVNR